jgi:hypothetical protein
MKTVYIALSSLLFAAGSALAAQPPAPPRGDAPPVAPIHLVDCDKGAGPCAVPPPPPAPPAPPPPPKAMKGQRLVQGAQPPAPPAPPRPMAAPVPPIPPMPPEPGPQPR